MRNFETEPSSGVGEREKRRGSDVWVQYRLLAARVPVLRNGLGCLTTAASGD